MNNIEQLIIMRLNHRRDVKWQKKLSFQLKRRDLKEKAKYVKNCFKILRKE